MYNRGKSWKYSLTKIWEVWGLCWKEDMSMSNMKDRTLRMMVLLKKKKKNMTLGMVCMTKKKKNREGMEKENRRRRRFLPFLCTLFCFFIWK